MTRPFQPSDHKRRFRHLEYGYTGVLEYPPASTVAARRDEAVLWHDGDRVRPGQRPPMFPSTKIYVRPKDVEPLED